MASLDDIATGNAGDDEFDMDFSGAVEFGQLTGEHPAVITSAEKDKSAAGNPKMVVKFEITEGTAKGAKRTRHCPTTGKGAGIAKQVLKATGMVVDDPKVRVKLSDLVGKPVILVMGPQKDNDEFDEIKRVKAAAPQGL